MTAVVQPVALQFDLANLKLFPVQKHEGKTSFVTWPKGSNVNKLLGFT